MDQRYLQKVTSKLENAYPKFIKVDQILVYACLRLPVTPTAGMFSCTIRVCCVGYRYGWRAEFKSESCRLGFKVFRILVQ